MDLNWSDPAPASGPGASEPRVPSSACEATSAPRPGRARVPVPPAQCAPFTDRARSQRLVAAPQLRGSSSHCPTAASAPRTHPVHLPAPRRPSTALGCLRSPCRGLLGGTGARRPQAEPPASLGRAPAGSSAGAGQRRRGHARRRQQDPTRSAPAGPMAGAGFAPSHCCRPGTSHPRTSEPPAAWARWARHAASKPLGPSVQRPAARAKSKRGRPGGAACPQAETSSVMQTAAGAVSTSWTTARQSGAFLLLLLLLLKQLPVPHGQQPRLYECLHPHTDHAVAAGSQGLSLPGVPQEVGAGAGLTVPPHSVLLSPRTAANQPRQRVSQSLRCPQASQYRRCTTGNQRKGCPCTACTNTTAIASGREQGAGAMQAPGRSRGGEGALYPVAGEFCPALWPCWDFPPHLHPQ